MKDDASIMVVEKGLTLRKGGYWDYQRRIPKDLIHHYNNQTKVNITWVLSRAQRPTLRPLVLMLFTQMNGIGREGHL